MIQELSYIGFASPQAAAWTSYGPNLLGCELTAPGPDGAVRLKVDDVDYRIAVHPGETDELRYIGWGVANETDLASFTAELVARGVQVHEATPELLAERQAAGLAWFEDPFGIRHELAWGRAATPNSFRAGRNISGFVTGDQGLGHAVLIVPDMQQANAFYADVLGFRLSDRIVSDMFNLRFYHCNGRHHSLAVAEVPGMVGFNHLMLEVSDIDDLGSAIDLCPENDTDILLSLGRHTNDLMTSIYISTPSSFQIEYGFGGLVVDDLTWSARTYDRPSIWGHHRSERFMTSPPGIVHPVGEQVRA